MPTFSEAIMPTDKQPSIACTELGKCYRIYDNPTARLKQALWREKRKYYREFWALRHVSFEIMRGESLGIIGRNGSGKSTLLQLICGTLTPTEGRIQAHGRIAALLELGSGFNPEFTGIENAYLNASMLGLSKEATDARIDDILSFADIGEFVYQPVKTYSSGMTVRLAFAIIAHVDASILVVDEALAVGDAFFTQKCMRFINRFRAENCLLFVSHDAGAVASLCNKALLLRDGKLMRFDTPRKVIDQYTKDLYEAHQDVEMSAGECRDAASRTEIEESCNIDSEEWIDYRAELINSSGSPNLLAITQFDECIISAESFGTGKASILSAELIDAASRKCILVGRGGERVLLRVKAVAIEEIARPIVGFLLKNEKGLILLGDNSLNSRTQLLGHAADPISKGSHYYAEFEFTLPLLPKGKYSFTISLAEGTQDDHHQLQWLNDALILESINSSIAAGLAGVPMHRITVYSLKTD